MVESSSEATDPGAHTSIEENINSRIHGPVSGLIIKYFAKFDSAVSRNVVDIQKLAGAPSSGALFHWLSSFSAQHLDGARGTWHTSCHSISAHESASSSAHLFLTRSTTFNANAKDRWRDVQVVGQVCKDEHTAYERDF